MTIESKILEALKGNDRGMSALELANAIDETYTDVANVGAAMSHYGQIEYHAAEMYYTLPDAEDSE